MKYLAHVPTEQYGFLSVEIEGSADDAVQAYKELQRAWRGGEGLTTKEFNKFLDNMLLGGEPLLSDDYASLSAYQTDIVQTIKRSIKRITPKEDKKYGN